MREVRGVRGEVTETRLCLGEFGRYVVYIGCDTVRSVMGLMSIDKVGVNRKAGIPTTFRCGCRKTGPISRTTARGSS